MRPLSLTLRLTLLFSIASTCILALFGWLLTHLTEKHFEAGDLGELAAIANTVEQALSDGWPADNLVSVEKRFADILVGHHRASLYIVTPDQQTVYASPGPDLSAIVHSSIVKSGDTYVSQWNNMNHSYRVLVKHAGETASPYTIAIAVQTDYHLRFLDQFREVLWLMIAASIVIMSLVGWFAVHRGHAPLHDIIARIRRITASELNTRLSPESFPAELTDLAIAFNGMLKRVDEAFHRLSDFNADIAHELRTPITNLMTQTQVALSRARTIDQYREILYSNIEEYERMAQMVSDMLFLAQTDNSPPQQSISDIDLAREMRVLFDYYDGWAEERSVSLSLKGSATVPADRLMLQRALGNLLSNAIRHTPAGKTVLVEIDEPGDNEVTVVVENSGPEIPAEHLPKLFDRFYRVERSRQRDGSGSGLGLAIVKTIVEAHGGNITVRSDAGRTRFEIRLPRTKTLPDT